MAVLSAARPRRTESMMSSARRCQTNGWGLSFQCEIHTSIASRSYAMDRNAEFVSRRRVSTENQPSTRLSHDDLVGVKRRWQRFCAGFDSQSRTGAEEE